MVAILLDLGPLVDINDVLEGEPVQAEDLPECTDSLRIPQSLNIHPGHRPRVEKITHALRILDCPLRVFLRPVCQYPDNRMWRFWIDNQGSRRCARRRAAVVSPGSPSFVLLRFRRQVLLLHESPFQARYASFRQIPHGR